MAESSTIARPYADAAFKFANDKSDLKGWSDALARLNVVMGTPEAQRLISNPRIPADALASTLADAAGQLNAEQRNFVRLLADNHRLEVLPEIVEQYDTQKSQSEGTLDVRIDSAFPLNDEQKNQIVETLKSKYGKNIHATTQVDPELIGGVAIRIGDEVIDASVRGKLAQLAASLKS